MSGPAKVYVGKYLPKDDVKHVVTSNGAVLAKLPECRHEFSWGNGSDGSRALAAAITLDLLGDENPAFTKFLVTHVFSILPKSQSWTLTSIEIGNYLKGVNAKLYDKLKGKF
jgi:hypothetical protein